MRLRLHQRNQQVDPFSLYEDELVQIVQRASMEMEQRKKLIGASGASIDALETTKYRSEEYK
ncbi:hypothetical protein FRX31_034757 [Thalictrum thalictroides]|uniref:Uncharacterized protein n=1 Tax=Thalictrum thalictroides TaxID=46969 RepID=A0A7J6UU10_THATH|nr:hypothetical protein FRX31_034757 [Thalictrum thalictroides]